MFDLFPAFTKITREGLNNIPRAVLSMIRPGPGISIFPTGDGGICISTQQQQGMQQGGLMGGGTPNSATPMMLGRLDSIYDGNILLVYLYDYDAGDWDAFMTAIYKPHLLRYDTWSTGSITYMDGTTRSYDVSDLDARYQRRATWEIDGDEYTEVQEITEPYFAGEWIWIFQTVDGALVDSNQGAHAWAVNGDIP